MIVYLHAWMSTIKLCARAMLMHRTKLTHTTNVNNVQVGHFFFSSQL